LKSTFTKSEVNIKPNLCPSCPPKKEKINRKEKKKEDKTEVE